MKKNIMALDVDFVLLDWVGGLKPFMFEKGMDVEHLDKYIGSTYYPTLQELFKIEEESVCINLMKEYNASPHIAHLPIFQEDSRDVFKEMYKNNIELVAVTCVGAEEKTRRLRMKNLQRYYGKEIFPYENVIAIPVRTSKEPHLRKLKERGSVIGFVDDREGHLDEAKACDITGILYTNDGKRSQCDNTVVIDCLNGLPELSEKLIMEMERKSKAENSKIITYPFKNERSSKLKRW